MQNAWTALRAVAAIVAVTSVPPVLAADFYGENISYETEDHFVTLRGGFGATAIEAREYVFDFANSDNHVSELIWQSLAPMATGELIVNLPDDWTFKARAKGAMSGDSYMEDYDWFGPDFVSYDFDDWTHRSQHTSTNLDWYVDANIAIGRNIMVEDDATVNINAGLRYTDIQWTAIGGSYIYSDTTVDNAGNNYHAYSGTFADVPVIRYRQQLPVLFAGLDVTGEEGPWKYDVAAQAGLTFFGTATDDHYLRDLRFIDRLKPRPMLAMTATGGYDFTDNFGIFAAASIEKFFLSRADTEYIDTTTDTSLGTSADIGGAELASLGLSVGLKGAF